MNNQLLFDEEELIPWAAEWQNMPEFSLDDLSPQFSVIVNFSCAADVADFSAAIGLDVTLTTSGARQLPSVWFPSQEIGRMVNKRYIDAT